MLGHSEFPGWSGRKLIRPALFLGGQKSVQGFTLIELIMVISIIGILAVAALPRIYNRATFDARGFYDSVLAINRHAQKLAIAQHRNVTVNINAGAGTVSACFGPAGCAAIPNPATQAAYTLTAPTGVTLATSTASFVFDPNGRPVPDAAVTINVTGDATTRTVTIERETGYVH